MILTRLFSKFFTPFPPHSFLFLAFVGGTHSLFFLFFILCCFHSHVLWMEHIVSGPKSPVLSVPCSVPYVSKFLNSNTNVTFHLKLDPEAKEAPKDPLPLFLAKSWLHALVRAAPTIQLSALFEKEAGPSSAQFFFSSLKWPIWVFGAEWDDTCFQHKEFFSLGAHGAVVARADPSEGVNVANGCIGRPFTSHS